MPETFHTTRRVEFGDTDMAGIMHFAKFFNFMEEAECEFLRSRGLSVVKTQDGQKVGLPRVAAKCEFFKPAFFEDVLDLHITLRRMGTKSLTYVTEFFKAGELIARGEVVSCCCIMGGPDGPVGLPLPDELRKALAG